MPKVTERERDRERGLRSGEAETDKQREKTNGQTDSLTKRERNWDSETY